MADSAEDRISKLEENIGTLGQHVQQLVELQKQAAQPSKEPEKPKEEQFNVDDLDEQQLENLSRKDFLKTIAKMTGSQVSQAVSGLSEKLESTEQRATQADLKQEVQSAMTKHPELPYFAEELKEMFQKNPGLSVDRMMTLIKAENPQKVKQAQDELAKKAEGENKEGDGGESKEGEETGHEKSGSEAGKQQQAGAGGGMSPSGAGTAGGPGEEGKMSMNEAVRATMSEIGFDSQGG